jgi:hypothetical protein
MELIAHYLEIHKKINPWLKDYLERGSNLCPHEFALKAKAERAGHPFFRLARQSGKTEMQMDMMQQVMEQQQLTSGPYPRITISDELREDLHSPLDDAILRMSTEYARAVERRLWESIMRSLPNEQSPSIDFQNGSRINPLPSYDAVRGRSYQRYGVSVMEPPQFRMEYMADFGAGDTDGDVSPVPYDPSQQT